MLRTRFTDLVGCRVPIQLAGMSGCARPPLAAAVAEAGGLGMLGGGGIPGPKLQKWLEDMRNSTSGVYGVTFVIPFLEPFGSESRDAIEVAARGSKVVEFFYGPPDPSLVGQVHTYGALASWQVGSRDEAVRAEKAGCDLIVAQGVEAGGHVRGQVGLTTLLPEVLDSVAVPVVAAGGIGTGRAMAAVLTAGASAVRIGTRFVATRESEAHPAYVEKLISASSEDTVLTERFSLGWPNAPHRVLRSCVDTAERFQGEVVGESTEVADPGVRFPVIRFSPFGPDKSTTGEIAAMWLAAGESVGAVIRVQSAAEVLRELADGAEALLAKRGN